MPKKRPAAAKLEDGVDRSFLDSCWKPVLLQEPAPKIAKEARSGMLCRISDRILAETLAISTSFLAATFSAPLAFSKSPSARFLLLQCQSQLKLPGTFLPGWIAECSCAVGSRGNWFAGGFCVGSVCARRASLA